MVCVEWGYVFTTLVFYFVIILYIFQVKMEHLRRNGPALPERTAESFLTGWIRLPPVSWELCMLTSCHKTIVNFQDL